MSTILFFVIWYSLGLLPALGYIAAWVIVYNIVTN